MRSLLLVCVVFGLLLGCGTNAPEEAQRVHGKLEFESKAQVAGIEVEHAPGTRYHLTGHPTTRERAVWTFGALPVSFKSEPSQSVPLVFTFSFLSNPVVENRGADVNIRIATWRCPQKPPVNNGDPVWQWADPARAVAYEERAKELMFEADQKRERGRRWFVSKEAIANAKAILSSKVTVPGTPEWEVANRLAEEFGFYEIVSKEVFGGDETTVLVPAGLFKNAAATTGPDGRALPAPPTERVKVYIKCETTGQMLGVAESELYFQNPK